MSSRTYYDILGVSRDATLEEITSAKNALAKVYHPDANMHKDIDTTAFMQEILEAYRVLSNPAKRKAYNLEIFGVTDRVFKTFKLTPEDEKESVSFVTYWNAAVQLQDIIDQSVRVMERASRTKTLSQKLMKKLGKNNPDEMHRERQLSRLSMQAMRQITTLKMAGIPSEYWNIDAMNWVLVRWGQRQDTDFRSLFKRYDIYVEKHYSVSEKKKLHAYKRQFHHNLKKLLSYALEA